MLSLSRNTRAQAMIEFILVIPIILILLYGIVDLVHMAVIKHALDSACREGVRFASVDLDLGNANWNMVQQRVANILEAEGIRKGSRHIAEDVEPAEITVDHIGGQTQSAVFGSKIEVSVRVRYAHAFAAIVADDKKTVTLRGSAVASYIRNELE